MSSDLTSAATPDVAHCRDGATLFAIQTHLERGNHFTATQQAAEYIKTNGDGSIDRTLLVELVDTVLPQGATRGESMDRFLSTILASMKRADQLDHDFRERTFAQAKSRSRRLKLTKNILRE